MHYYVFYRSGAALIYERTCGAEWAAEDRVKELKAMGHESFYSTELPKEPWFY